MADVGVRIRGEDIPHDIWQLATRIAMQPKKAGSYFSDNYTRPIAEAILAERERCAKVADAIAAQHEADAPHEDTDDYRERKLVYAKHVRRVADAIRHPA